MTITFGNAAVIAVFLASAAGQAVFAHEVSRSSTPAAGAEAPTTEIEFHIDGDGGAASVIEVPKGSHVRLLLTGAGEREMHLHGYDVLVEGTSDGPAVFEFDAEHTGRFPITVHGVEDLLGQGEKALAYVEVRDP